MIYKKHKSKFVKNNFYGSYIYLLYNTYLYYF